MKCKGFYSELPFTLFWLHSPWRGSWDDGAFTCTLQSCTQTSIFSPCPQFKTICKSASGNTLCLLLLSGQLRAEIQDAENGKGEEILRCPHQSMSSAAQHERRVNLSPHSSPSFSRPNRLEAVLALAAHLPGHLLPQSLVPTQGLLLRPCGASLLDGDSHRSSCGCGPS